MKNMFALLAVTLTTWAYTPIVFADDASDLNADSSASLASPGHGGPGHGGPGHGGPGHGGPGFGGPGHGGPGFGGPGHGGPGPGGPGHGGPGHGGPGFGGPGHGGPGHGWHNPGWGHPGWGHPGHPGWGPRPGWRPGHGPGRPGWNPGWGNGHWGRPGRWRFPHHGFGWYPPVFIPLPPPPSDAGDFLCYGNFVGVFGQDRDAYLSMNTENYDVDGSLTVEDPEATYEVDGTCEQVGDAADVSISLDGGQPYVGQIYRADDGQVYFEGTQQGTGINFSLQRQ